MSCRCHSHHAQRQGVPVGSPRNWREATIVLVHGDRSTLVCPASLPARHHLTGLGVRLVELWHASRLDGDLEDLWFDFEGEGGYRPSRNACPPLHGPLLELGYLQLEKGRIEWEPEADVSCAYRVKGLTTIVAQDSPDRVILRTGH